MEYIDYTTAVVLFGQYMERFSADLDRTEIELAAEMRKKLNTLHEISDEICLLVAKLFAAEALTPSDDDIIVLGPFKIRLLRAEPGVPIKLDNVTRAYSGTAPAGSSGEQADMERRLERLAVEFYQVAHRITHITDALPGLKSFKCRGVRVVRNHLIEHPEGAASGVTHESFAYSKDEGPYVKGMRKGDQLKHMDLGFKRNSDDFVGSLAVTLQATLLAGP